MIPLAASCPQSPGSSSGRNGVAITAIYDRLRRLAARYLGNERPDRTLQATALVHEAYLSVALQGDIAANPPDFFARTARAMRRVLVDHARRRRAVKRGGGRPRVALDEAGPYGDGDAFVVSVDGALHKLAAIDSQQGRIVELRFFAGMTIEETAAVLGISARSVNREWLIAKAWLHRELSKLE